MSTSSEKVAHHGSERRRILHVGRIGRAHGLHGEIRVTILGSDPERLLGLGNCLLVSADEKITRSVIIESVHVLKNKSLVKLQGIDDRTQAESLTGWFLSVDRAHAVPLHQDEWFVCDLIGCRVYDEAKGNLGIVRDILQSSASDVYVIHEDDSPDLLMPALKKILLRVDVENKRIDVSLPDGLYEVYRQKGS